MGKGINMINKKVILSVAVAAVILTGCGSDKKTTQEHEMKTETAAPVAHEVKKEEATAVETTTKAVTKSVQDVAKKVEDVAKSVQEQAPAAVAEVAKKVEEVSKTVTEAAAPVAKKVEDSMAKVAAATAPVIAAAKTAVAGPDGTKLYAKCAGCHGATAEKKALGKSQVVKGWDAAKIAEALKGYKAGTYGGSMKGIMKGQVASFSDADIEAVSAHIASF